MIAEHFRHYDEGAFLIEKLNPNAIPGLNLTKERIFATLKPNIPAENESLRRLGIIYHGEFSDAIISSGYVVTNLIKFILSSLVSDDWRVFWKFYRAKMYPIIVCIVNVLGINPVWSKGIHSTIRDGRPQHKLLEVFPTILPKNEYATVRKQKEDENAFVRYDPAVEFLYLLLKKLKDDYEANCPATPEDDIPIILPTVVPDDEENFEDE